MKKTLAIVFSIVGIVCIIAGYSLNKNASSTNSSREEATASSLDYFEIIDGNLTALTEEGLKQKELVIPESVTWIDSRVFSPDWVEKGTTNDVLEKVTFLNPDLEIKPWIFSHCTVLQEVVLPANLTSIPDHCFTECKNLKSITIPNSVTSIGEGAFDECSSLKSVTFGSSVVSIGEEAFRECSSLTQLEFNTELETIGDYAFADCHSIQSVTIPESVTSIGAGTFSNAYDTSGEYKIIVTQGSWADLNFDSYKSGDENVKKEYI